jgi:hypothetical protein
MKISLFVGDGTALVYSNCTVDTSLAPDLWFYGCLKARNGGMVDGPRKHYVTTLPYLIEEEV